MRLVERYFRESRIDEITVFWEFEDLRYAIIGHDWGDTKSVLARLLERMPGGAGQYANTQSALARLGKSGGVLPMAIGSHLIGLVRPHVYGELTGSEPVLIGARDRGSLLFPILVDSVEEARGLVRRLQREQGAPVSFWRRFSAERAPSSADKFSP
jgi:hypothetical protein